ncbi:MAG: CDP-diacylglycerol--glycerol-3-phosphate 3-phosphatidyltransferase [Candidatus Hydrogenedentota bacterium]
MNLPNKLTVGRLIMVPIFVVLMSIENPFTYIAAYVVFTAASITDYFDGKIARERNLVTNFGKLMDPLADKVLMSAAFVMAMQVPSLTVPAWAIVAILAREFLVTGARSMVAPQGTAIAANDWGKLKMVLQMVYIYVFLFLAIGVWGIERWLPEHLENYIYYVSGASHIGIVLVAILTVYTGIQFAQANWKSLNLSSQQ